MPNDAEHRQQAAILDVVASILSQSSIPALFRELTGKLSRFVPFDRLALLLYNEQERCIVLREVHSLLGHGAPLGHVYPMDETPAGEVVRKQERFYIDDVASDDRYPLVMNQLRAENLLTFCYFPLTSPARRLGALGFGTRTEVRYSEEQLGLIERALKPVAIAVENILNREEAESDRDRLKLMLEVNNTLIRKLDTREIFQEISRLMQSVVPHDFLSMSLWYPEREELRLRVASGGASAPAAEEEVVLTLEDTPSGIVFTSGQPMQFNFEQLRLMSPFIRDIVLKRNVRSMCSFPLETARGRFGTINLGSSGEDTFDKSVMNLLQGITAQLAIAVENARAFAGLEELNRRLHETKVYLEEELLERTSDEILGNSPGIRKVLQQIDTVSATDATVLISGETGSGKELVARALHQRSSRRKGTFVKLNCAAIPTGLLESELFGHEKGAFTGAIMRKIGRFEIAHQGTLFLDEVGEIPLELQPKLLRVLQEKEFERLGGIRTIRSDARLVAATNRDLKKMAEANQFRADLYYRLNVFPIVVPPLRERREDIPVLAKYFTQEFSRQFGRKIVAIPRDAMKKLEEYHWPGNIRELHNLIERSVILTQGDTLRIPLEELESPVRGVTPSTFSGTMVDVEREAILRAIEDAGGQIGGPKGAAARLGMKRTTLLYRMDKLGIQRDQK